MKKKGISFAAALCLAAVLLCACSPAHTDYSQYVKLGEYKGLEVKKIEVQAVTDEDVETYIDKVLSSTASYQTVDRPIQLGDTVNLSFTGFYASSGEAIPSAASESYDLTIGSKTFIDGFESGLIGAKAGDELTLNLTYPESYYNPNLAGVAVRFEVKILKVQVSVKPVLDDTFVRQNSDCLTVDEYRIWAKQQLEEAAVTAAASEKEEAVWKAVMDGTEILGYPEDKLEEFREDYKTYYKNLASSRGLSLDTFLQNYYETTAEEFEEKVDTWAKTDLSYTMTAKMIANRENIRISDEEYAEGLASFIKQAGFEDAADFRATNGYEFEEQYGKDAITDQLLFRKVVSFVTEQSREIG